MALRLAAPLCVVALPILASTGHAVQAEEVRRKYEGALRELGETMAAEQLELASSARKKGLYPQAARELHACLERAGTPRAAEYLSLMQTRDKEWWQRRPTSKPTASALAAYDRKAGELRERELRSRLELALDVARDGLAETALADARKLLVELDEALEMRGGRLRALGSTLPADLSERLWAEAVDIDGRRYLKDAFLEALDADERLHEARDELLSVRSQRGVDEARAFHGLARALVPYLEEELASRAHRRLNLFLCASRNLYERYLERTKQTEFRRVSGLADVQRNTAIVVLDDFLDPRDAQACVLHELTHLFMYQVAPTPMPSWYAEGLAEIYGAQGTFTWDGATLTVGGRLPAERIRSLLASDSRFGLSHMLEGDAVHVWTSSGGDRAPEFYTDAWALLTFLREGAGRRAAATLLEWEITCRGDGLVGARQPIEDEKGRWSANVRPAHELFRELFASELAELEDEFAAWLAEYE